VRRPVAVRVIGPMSWLIWPALAAVLVTVLFATPIHIFGLALPQPVWPMVLAFAWPLIRPSILGPVILFGLGFFLDLFWGGMLGLWPLALVAVYGGVLALRSLLAGQETLFLFLLYCACVLAAFFLAYIIVMMSVGQAPSLWATAGQVLPTLILFPIADWLIQRFDDGDTRFR